MSQEPTQADEMLAAYSQKRQPMCVYCEKPLDRIIQTQYQRIAWGWDPKLGEYVKEDSDGDADPPYHPGCWCYDWGYVDENLVSY